MSPRKRLGVWGGVEELSLDNLSMRPLVPSLPCSLKGEESPYFETCIGGRFADSRGVRFQKRVSGFDSRSDYAHTAFCEFGTVSRLGIQFGFERYSPDLSLSVVSLGRFTTFCLLQKH